MEGLDAGARVGFPRLYAAASLKTRRLGMEPSMRVGFSAALCRGLIEDRRRGWRPPRGLGFSAALCRGLIEEIAAWSGAAVAGVVFRGFMPRPH